MKMLWERYGNCFWHYDCPKESHHSGIMKIVRHEEKATLFECLHCGQKGRYPVGGSGMVCVEEVKE